LAFWRRVAGMGIRYIVGLEDDDEARATSGSGFAD
jgi:hypothetical protein